MAEILSEEVQLSENRKHFDQLPTPPESEHSEDDRSGDLNSCKSSGVDFLLPPETTEPTQILETDKKTPDRWLPRDPRLIRLTGAHPFNVEAPLTELFNEGFLTSPELFFVRNHGPVPQVKQIEVASWELSVEGLVDHPLRLTLTDLLEQFEQKTCPITLVCAGNRRKEQNIVRKTKGFSWGAAGVSTALFTGIDMAEVIKRAKPRKGARYVCMEGADELPNGNYGTSVKLNWVMDPNRGIMLSHKMNGEPLRPDHGKPLRAVIPGQIGGRSVKWLKRLIITAEPSDNWYHINDNRVLPTMISPDTAANDKSWWKDERYAIFDLSTNSAIAHPAHDEQLTVSDPDKAYTVQGYAYGGGGRRVTRVEISLDRGKTWCLASVAYPEDQYKAAGRQQLYGSTIDMGDVEASFCWCQWKLEVPMSSLATATDIVARAMDESMNIQPRDMYWSVLGMMNNPWYRIAILREGDNIRFEHPTQPALMPGGWMERVKKAGGDISNGFWGERLGDETSGDVAEDPTVDIKMTSDDVKRQFTANEIRQHDKDEHPWFVVDNQVYDGTAYLKEHPGGAQSIISAAGTDCSEEFLAIHSETAKAMMRDYHIGSIDSKESQSLIAGEIEANGNEAIPVTFLDARRWKKATLLSKTTVSWDSRVFRFKLEDDSQTLGMPVGQHAMMRLRDPVTREVIIRSYTPVSTIDTKGVVDILVKVYFASTGNEGGKMSQALESLPLGHFIDLKGPIGKFEYLGNGKCQVKTKERILDTLIMVSGGSGITPMFQVLRAILEDGNDPTKCVLIDGNRLEEDILCRAELDTLAWNNPDRFQLIHTLTKGTDEWQGLRGRIAVPLLKEHASRAMHDAGKAMVLICGPSEMEKAVQNALMEDGWAEDDLHVF